MILQVLKTFIFLLTPVIFSNSVYGQEKPVTQDIRNVISGYPAHFFISSLKLGYEIPANEKLNIKLIGSITSTDISYYYDTDTLLAFGFELQPRFYFHRIKNNFSGFYTGSFIMFNTAKYVEEDWYRRGTFYPGSVSSISPGYIMGFQYLSDFGLSFEIYGGGGFNFSWGNYKHFDLPLHPFRRGVTPHAGLAFGYGF